MLHVSSHIYALKVAFQMLYINAIKKTQQQNRKRNFTHLNSNSPKLCDVYILYSLVVDRFIKGLENNTWFSVVTLNNKARQFQNFF